MSGIEFSSTSIVTEDGRVFYDLDVLIAQYEPRIEAREFGAMITKNPVDEAYVQGERAMLEAIRESAESLRLDNPLED